MAKAVEVNKGSSYPFPIRIWNYAGRLTKGMGIDKRLSIEMLMGSAKKETGLSDFGDEYFIEPLQKLVESINEEANLHAFGKYVTIKRLVNLLSNRLRAETYFKKHPEILETEILPIWWIVGLQRTGTTFLHRMIANTPATASIYSWEALNPVPFENDADNKRRIQIGRQSERGLRYIAPEFFAIHPVEHLSPEEEVLLLDMSFLSTVPEATLNVPTYAKWLGTQDQTPAYLYMRDILKLLQARRPGAMRWILKSPHHLEFLEETHATFPEAKFIFTHRDPIKTLASFCSMVYFSKRIFSSSIKKEEIAAHWKRKISIMLNKSLKFRADNIQCPVIDVPYSNIKTEPAKEVKRIFQTFNAEWNKDVNERIQEIITGNKKDKYGAHKYLLTDFGLLENELEKEFSEYRTKYSHLI